LSTLISPLLKFLCTRGGKQRTNQTN
jgi:hypothetical protein